MLYSYIALNSENQKLKGVIEGDNKIAAKKKLHSNGLSVLSIEETSKVIEQEKQNSPENISPAKNTPLSTGGNRNSAADSKSLRSFSFFVIDAQGKNISGAIESISRKTALKRLATEYKFEIVSLCSSDIAKEMQFEAGKKGLEQLKKEVSVEFGISFNKYERENKDTEDLYGEKFKLERKQIIKEIEVVSNKTKQLLDEHGEKIPPEIVDKIQDMLSQLQRLKFSNNFTLIRKLIEDLFDTIEDAMKKHVMVQEYREHKRVDLDSFVEAENREAILSRKKKRSSNKDILGKLQAFSSSIDNVLNANSKKITTKKKQKSSLQEFFTNIKFFKRIVEGFISALFFTKNKDLQKERLKEAKKKYSLWKEKREEQKEQNRVIKQIEELKKQQNPDAEKNKIASHHKIFVLITDELYIFSATLVVIIFFIAYFLLLVDKSIIPNMFPEILELKNSQTLPKIAFTVFFLFFTFFLQKKFFYGKILPSILFFMVMGFVLFLYFYNL
jgi:hypothetical protein